MWEQISEGRIKEEDRREQGRGRTESNYSWSQNFDVLTVSHCWRGDSPSVDGDDDDTADGEAPQLF